MLHLRKAQKAVTEIQCVKKLEVAMAAKSQGSFDDLWKIIESDLAPSLPNEENIKKGVETQFMLVLIHRPNNQVETLIDSLKALNSLTDCNLKYKETYFENMKILHYPEIKDYQNQLDQGDKEIHAIGLSIESEKSVPFQITIERCLNWLKELAGSIISWEEHQKSKHYAFVIKGFLRSLQPYFVNIRSKLCRQVCQSIVAQHHMMYSFELEKLTSLKEDFKLQYELLRSNASDAEKAEKIGIRVCELADAYIEGKINQTISSMEAEVNYWATSEEATERAYEKSFTLLHDDNMKAYIENPSDFIEKLFHADLDGATVSTVQRRVEDLQSATVELMKKVKSVVMAWIENVQLEPVDEICEALFLRISRHDEKLFSKYGLCQRTQLYNLIGTLSAAEKDAVVLTLEGCLAERRKIAEQMQLLLPDLSFDVDSMVFKKAFQRASEICDFPNYLQSSFSDWFKDQMILAKNDSSIVLKKPVNVTSLLDAVAKELGSTGANVGLLICRPGTKVIDHVSFAKTVLSSFETNFKICGLLNKPSESTKIDFNKIKLRLNEHLIYMRSKLRITAIGCMSTCPFCGAKCKLPHDHGGAHEVISHMIPALSGRLRTRITANRYETTLNIYTSDMRILDYNNEKVIFPVQEFVKKYHTTWHPFNTELTDIQKQRERNLRMAWIALRPWCLEKNRELYPYLEDSTPTGWEQMYRRI
ncbi:hypothetical protein HK096_009516 [Nowakowskiella sp. JEL0078]|nr:hypothetical protein HK096_009516 [Nowakowskiella sp. JEL0078]